MAFDFYRGIVDQIASRSYKVILHNWGEPLLHPEIVDMVEYASRKGLATELSTNLNTLPDRMPADLVRAGLERIVISIDGATQESYENYRRGGRLSDVLANLRRIAEAKKELRSRTPVIEASALIMRSNEKELEAVARQAEEAGADRFELRCIIVNVLDQRQVEEWLPTDTRYVRYDESLKRDRLSEAGRRCSWPWRSLVVNWDGTVYPCCNFERKEAEVGDLRNTSLADLWNGELYRDIRRLFAGKRPPVPSLSDASNICEWCAGIPRAPSATQAGVY
jgi:radical SAM protein with 4Fe4S-binding SPASM domain